MKNNTIMRFTIDNTDSYENTGCDECLFDGEWYEENDLIDSLKELDLVNIEAARGFISVYDLELHFPAEFYIDDDDKDDDDDE